MVSVSDRLEKIDEIKILIVSLVTFSVWVIGWFITRFLNIIEYEGFFQVFTLVVFGAWVLAIYAVTKET